MRPEEQALDACASNAPNSSSPGASGGSGKMFVTVVRFLGIGGLAVDSSGIRAVRQGSMPTTFIPAPSPDRKEARSWA